MNAFVAVVIPKVRNVAMTMVNMVAPLQRLRVVVVAVVYQVVRNVAVIFVVR